MLRIRPTEKKKAAKDIYGQDVVQLPAQPNLSCRPVLCSSNYGTSEIMI